MQPILEEEIKNSVAANFFKQFDCTKILGKIDFAVKHLPSPIGEGAGGEVEYLLWAEAKQKPADPLVMLSQLVLTIGKARTFDEIMPPKFLGCFDSEKIAFIPYHEIQDIFYQNDFNWNVAPSNHETREFQLIKAQIDKIINHNLPFVTYQFYFEKDEKELRKFIKENFIVGKNDIAKIKIDKNNFKIIFNKWTESVMPQIAVDWNDAKKQGIIAGDFYLADLLSKNNKTLKDKLFILLKSDYYEADRHLNNLGFLTSSRVEFKDNQKAHNEFWNKYERPPHEDYWDYIINRRDMLVPPDVRERKGSFFTPKIWVELSQKYLADVFGENWQEEYYIWDCCAGTGNLLEGLTNKYKIFASTLDKQDVFVMLDRIKNGANLLENHVFQFDFLNDSFDKLPENLQEIIKDEKRRKNLIIYINPPYVEAASARTVTGTGSNRPEVTTNKTKEKYKNLIGNATNELFALFLIRLYCEVSGCKIGQFSTQKILNAPNFKKFRAAFQAKLENCFIMPADTFDNVNGQFPIGFKIWNTDKKIPFKSANVDVFDENANYIGKKTFFDGENIKYINDWYRKHYDNSGFAIGVMNTRGNDVQNYNYIRISSDNNFNHTNIITLNNVVETCIYFAVRKVIIPTWLNDRDQFLYPNKKWEKDIEFQNNCLAYTIFNNNISVKNGVNHWLPFPEAEINARTEYASHILIGFLQGKKIKNAYTDLFDQQEKELVKREFSAEAAAVFDVGRELWRYYHSQFSTFNSQLYNVNASLYDIREYFQGRNDKGKMNSKSENETYNALIGTLRENLKILAQKIEPKVYEYEFLKE